MKAGDQSAFEAIYRKSVQPLYKYGNRFTKDQSLVEDAIHDLFLDLWNNRNSIGLTDSILPYLMTSLRRKLIKSMKKSSAISYKESDNEMDEVIEFSWPEKSDQQIELKLKLKTMMSQLTSRQQEIIYLKYMRGLDYEEIGEVMGMKYQSVRNLVHRAIEKIRNQIQMILFILCSSIEYKVNLSGL